VSVDMPSGLHDTEYGPAGETLSILGAVLPAANVASTVPVFAASAGTLLKASKQANAIAAAAIFEEILIFLC
jgi:hypothetical protein